MKILITGGASGLGKAITEKLCGDSNDLVFFTFCKSKTAADDLAKKFSNSKSIQVDFSNSESVKNLVSKISEMDIDVLINNAYAANTVNHFHKIPAENFTESFQVNVLPTILISQEAIKLFRKKKSGKIITILSSGLIGNPPTGWSEYTANKAYLHSMAKSWATENAAFNITSNCVSPSLMATDISKDSDPRVIEMAVAAHPLKKILTVEEVAVTVEQLTRASAHINGTNLVINAAANVI